jgi:hypothetical protein
VVADAVGGPAQRELRQVSGADHHAAVLVGKAEKVAGALAGLHVLEGDVVDLPALGVGMADVLQHLHAGGPDVDLLRAAAGGAHELPGLVAGARRGGEARHGVGEDVLAGKLELVHGARAYEQRLGRIQPPGYADDQALAAGRAHARLQAVDLDAVYLFTARVARRRIARHVGQALDAALELDAARRQGQREFNRAKALYVGLVAQRRVAERVLAHAIGEQAPEVDVGERHLRLVGKALGFGDQRAVFVDDGVPVPREVGGRFAKAGGAVQIGRKAARRLVGHQLVAVALLADHDVGSREVGDDRRAGERRE